MTRTIFKKMFFGSVILLESHERFLKWFPLGYCSCNHCNKLAPLPKYSFGFWIPESKTWNAWWTFYFVGKRNNYYLRFTLPFLKKYD